jgi:Na+/proline symporter
VLVLITGYAVYFALTQRPTRRTLVAAIVVLGVLVLALVLGGGSHVTNAIADGPVGLAEDFWRRLHLSWLRATSSWGVAVLVFGGIAALALLARRERRPLLLAYLAALAVSLLVNDSPNDVIVAGLAGYLVLSSAPGVARPADERVTPAAPAPRARSAPAASR